ncbi:MAG: glycosyltransferase, partial [Acidimicrobiales bacterium]
DGITYQPVEYEQRMPLLLAAADVVVARAGGTTVAELTAVGLPSILVPLPIAPNDHQRANAAALVGVAAAVLVLDADLDAERLATELWPLLDDPARRASMETAARALGRPGAADAVAELLERHARR